MNTINIRAEDLPSGSVIADDLKGIALYAQGEPDEHDRWIETRGDGYSNSYADERIARGANVVRVGDDGGRAPSDGWRERVAQLDAWLARQDPAAQLDVGEVRRLLAEGPA